MRHLSLAAAAADRHARARPSPITPPSVKADYDRDLGALWDYFHRNPELSFKEDKTGARMAAELRAVPGMVVTEKVGGTGVVGVLKNGAGPTVLLRADMDGLPVEEKSGLANATKVAAGRGRRRRGAGDARLRSRHAHHRDGRDRAAARGD